MHIRARMVLRRSYVGFELCVQRNLEVNGAREFLVKSGSCSNIEE